MTNQALMIRSVFEGKRLKPSMTGKFGFLWDGDISEQVKPYPKFKWERKAYVQFRQNGEPQFMEFDTINGRSEDSRTLMISLDEFGKGFRFSIKRA